MKAASGFLTIGLVILFLGGIMWALGQFRGVDFTEPHIIATAPTVTTANIILANTVLDDATTNIKIASNDVNDAPVPFSLNSVNNDLTINGLNANDSRTLTVTYSVPRLDPFIDMLARYFPAFLIIGCIVAVIGVCIETFRR